MMWFWLILGLGLIVAEFFLPALVAGSVGLAALLAAGVAWLGVPIWGQGLLWLGLSSVFIVGTRRLVPQETSQLEESREARSLSAIPAGRLGRVSYQGSTWNARCSIPSMDIPEGQDLYVVERKGNTLVVMPARLLEG
ncbi:MAG: NfeD family protein [Synechococcaceae cyanobacterium SM2_3_1]|nr:NfeD family protein [Synechococcaceae cyanobacterium SM2_3_1]